MLFILDGELIYVKCSFSKFYSLVMMSISAFTSGTFKEQSANLPVTLDKHFDETFSAANFFTTLSGNIFFFAEGMRNSPELVVLVNLVNFSKISENKLKMLLL